MSDAYYRAYENQQQIGRNQLARQAGGMIADGDMTGGRNALLRGGLLDEAGKVDTQLASTRKAKAEAASRFAQGLGKMMADPRYASNPDAAWQAAAPYAKRLGLDEADIEEDRQLFTQDHKGYVSMLLEKAQDELQAVNLGNGGVAVFNKGTGGLNVVREPQYQQEYIALPPGGALVPKPRGDMPPQTVTGGSPEPGAPAADPQQAVAALTGLGARVTSGQRTPQHNAAVGGVPNSRHLTGQAADLVPPAGMTMAQLEAETRRRMPGAKVINEGDHVHVEWGGGGQRAQAPSGSRYPPGTIMGPPKEVARPATAAEKAAYGIGPDVPAQMKPDGSLDVISGTGAANKRVPPKVAAGYTANKAAITQIDQAIAEIQANKGAMGLKNYLGDDFNQRMDPGGVGVRASVANIGSLKRHDRSGATVTAAESPILKPFIPSVTDNPDAAITKLTKLKQEYQNTNAEIDVEFGEESGYAPMGAARAAPSAPAAAPARASAGTAKAAGGSPPASALKAGHITTFANGQKWTLRNGKPARVQ
jgi:hypothetical protein